MVICVAYILLFGIRGCSVRLLHWLFGILLLFRCYFVERFPGLMPRLIFPFVPIHIFPKLVRCDLLGSGSIRLPFFVVRCLGVTPSTLRLTTFICFSVVC